MINDIFEAIDDNHIKSSIYADDVAFLTTHRKVVTAIEQIQLTLNKIEGLSIKWGLTLSPSKTKSIIFSKGIPSEEYNNLSITNNLIQYVPHYKYIGVVLDKALNFNKHFEHIIQKSTRRINIMKCIVGRKWGADRSTLTHLYISLIRPMLDYNAFLYDNVASKKIDSLQTIQNQALRIITGCMRATNINALHRGVDL